jgi:hypothetical protein
MAKMFGILKSPFANSPGRTAKQATRTGDGQMTAELNNLGRGADAGGKTKVTTTLFSDGSGFLTVTRGTEEARLRWNDDREVMAFSGPVIRETA